MPTPEQNESKDDYMGRCMAYPDMQKYDTSQRAAICNSMWDKHTKANISQEDFNKLIRDALKGE